MATTAKITYGASTTTVITLTTLAASTTGAGRQSLALDNTTNLFLDAMLYVECAVTTGTIGMDKCVYVYLYGSEDGTTFNEDTVTGTDGTIAFNITGNNLILGGVINFATSATGLCAQNIIIPSVATCFGGTMPRKWGFVIYNSTNIALSTTEALCVHTYTGIYNTSV